jgi:upstream activation factor subunit UAF30
MTQVSVKKIRRALQELFDVEFDDDKKKINELILERYHDLMEEREKEVSRKRKRMEEKDAKLAAQLQDEDNGRSGRRKSTPLAKPVKPRKKRVVDPNSTSISSLELNLSPKLALLLNKTRLPRTQVVKEVWDYIKLNNLQNPEDKREIICDEKMQEVFGKKISMFQMNKVLSNHLYKDNE